MPFQVEIEGKRFEVTCPPGVNQGQSMQVSLPGTSTSSTNSTYNKHASSIASNQSSSIGSSSSSTSSTTTGMTNHYVTVPTGIRAGMPFMVDVHGKRFRVTCPPTSKAGDRIQIALPTGGTASTSGGRGRSKSPTPPPNNSLHTVTVPQRIRAGMPFQVDVNGSRFNVTCPPNAGPGQRIQIRLPTTATNSNSGMRTPPRSQSPMAPSQSSLSPKRELFDVTVPAGVRPGEKFKIRAHGQQFIVTCPMNAGPGRKIRIPLTVPTTNTNHGGRSYV